VLNPRASCGTTLHHAAHRLAGRGGDEEPQDEVTTDAATGVEPYRPSPRRSRSHATSTVAAPGYRLTWLEGHGEEHLSEAR